MNNKKNKPVDVPKLAEIYFGEQNGIDLNLTRNRHLKIADTYDEEDFRIKSRFLQDCFKKPLSIFFSAFMFIGLIISITSNLFVILLKVLWNSIVLFFAISLTITWIFFVFGSVIGVILLLIFTGLEGFFIPMGLLVLWLPLSE